MSLDTLPEELMIIIIRQLDTKSVYNLYATGCSHIQNVISTHGVIKQCKFSLNTLATVRSLKLDFFKNITPHLQELDMCGVPDLKKTSLIFAMKKLKHLSTLNVSYTKITILDLLDFCELCPTIKNVTIDYQFYKNGTFCFPQELLEKCQNVFEHFQNVHFVGSCDNLLLSELPKLILEKAKLDELTYTIAKIDKMFTFYKYAASKPVHCNKFSLFFLHWRKISHPDEMFIDCPRVIKDLLFEYEFIHISNEVVCSPIFKSFFNERFNIEIRESGIASQLRPTIVTYSDLAIFIWNKDTTQFDESFFNHLFNKIQNIVPSLRNYNGGVDDDPELPVHRDWVCIRHPLILHSLALKKESDEPVPKLPRYTPPPVNLDYDRLLRDLTKVEVSINFYEHVRRPITLTQDSNYLKKLTFLSLAGTVRYSSEFFNVLFRCCENLVTLNVEAPPVSPCIPPISRSIPLTQSLKNLRIVDKTIDFYNLFSSLSQAKSLENIEIQDLSLVINELAPPDTLFRQCDNLYNLSLHAHMTHSARNRKLQMFNEAKQRYGKHHLRIELICERSHLDYTYDPFVQVFRLGQIKVIK